MFNPFETNEQKAARIAEKTFGKQDLTPVDKRNSVYPSTEALMVRTMNTPKNIDLTQKPKWG